MVLAILCSTVTTHFNILIFYYLSKYKPATDLYELTAELSISDLRNTWMTPDFTGVQEFQHKPGHSLAVSQLTQLLAAFSECQWQCK